MRCDDSGSQIVRTDKVEHRFQRKHLMPCRYGNRNEQGYPGEAQGNEALRDVQHLQGEPGELWPEQHDHRQVREHARVQRMGRALQPAREPPDQDGRQIQQVQQESVL